MTADDVSTQMLEQLRQANRLSEQVRDGLTRLLETVRPSMESLSRVQASPSNLAEPYRMLPSNDADTSKDFYRLKPEEPAAPQPRKEPDPFEGFRRALAPVRAVLEKIHEHVTTPTARLDEPDRGKGKPKEEKAPADPLKGALDSAQAALSRLPAFGPQLAALAGSVRQATGALGQAFAGAGKAAGAGAGPAAGAAGVAGAGAAGSLAGLASAAAPIAALVGAASAASSALQGVVSVSRGYVEALNPGVMNAYNLAVRDFTATVGVALQPVVQAATQFNRAFGSALLPAMERLEGAVRVVSDAVGGVLTAAGKAAADALSGMAPALRGVADLFAALAPVGRVLFSALGAKNSVLKPAFEALGAILSGLAVPLKFFGDLLASVTPLLEAFSAVMSGLGSAVRSAFDRLASATNFGLLSRAANRVTTALQGLARRAILAAANMAKFAGLDSFVSGMIKALEPANNTGRAAVQNPQLTGFEEYARMVMTAAQLSGPGGPAQDEQKTWRDGVLAELKGIREAQTRSWLEVARDVVAAVRGGGRQAGEAAAGAAAGIAGGPPRGHFDRR